MKAVLHSFAYCLDFLSEQVADIGVADMAAQPRGIASHPSWVIGHLAFICQQVGGVIGLAPWLADDFARRYGPGSVPVADASQYESKDKALAILRDAAARVTRAVSELDDVRLDAPFPDPSYHYVFPTVRHFLTQVLAGHTAYHVGQLNLWRQAMGLPRLGRAFE